jgi:hypothetical protein
VYQLADRLKDRGEERGKERKGRGGKTVYIWGKERKGKGSAFFFFVCVIINEN